MQPSVNSRTISISASKRCTDGDGVANIEEIKQRVNPANQSPADNNQPVIHHPVVD